MKKRVNIGSQAGETPKKVQTFTFDSAPSSIPAATPQTGRDVGGSPLKGVLAASKYGDTSNITTSLYGSPLQTMSTVPPARPKTSRGSSNPSPDEFFDYVVPSSPENKRAVDSAIVPIHRDDNYYESIFDKIEKRKGKEFMLMAKGLIFLFHTLLEKDA